MVKWKLILKMLILLKEYLYDKMNFSLDYEPINISSRVFSFSLIVFFMSFYYDF